MPILMIIPPDKWPHAGFTCQFFAADTETNCHVRWRVARAIAEFYFDVRVNRAEVLMVWPERPPKNA